MVLDFFKRNNYSTDEEIQSKIITVKEIHDEVDGLESVFLNEVNEILNSDALKVTKEERKSELAMELGFINSSVVKEAEQIKDNRLTLIQKTERAKLLEEYKLSYPLDKIIPLSMFEEVCEKYGLIVAPVENYIKDIPEKNLLELKNSKPTSDEHYPDDFIVLSDVSFMYDHRPEYKEYIRSFIGKNVSTYNIADSNISVETNIGLLAKGYNGVIGSRFFCNEAKFEICTRKSLYVSAPPSHFNTEGLRKFGKHHLKVVGIIEEDPIVFEYLKGDLIRIRTKWGTPDDQSYLDESVINEILN